MAMKCAKVGHYRGVRECGRGVGEGSALPPPTRSANKYELYVKALETLFLILDFCHKWLALECVKVLTYFAAHKLLLKPKAGFQMWTRFIGRVAKRGSSK